MSKGNPHPNSPWTDERKERLKQLWNDGWSASQIAAELGLISRSSVIGKVHRLGLSGRKVLTRTQEDPKRRHRASVESPRRTLAGTRFNPAVSLKSRTSKLLAQPREASMTASLKPVHILDRNMLTQCAWPLWGNRPAHSELMCCGNPIAQGERSYCECHARMSDNRFQPKPNSWIPKDAA
jgi:GcrA cell cycle regulator